MSDAWCQSCLLPSRLSVPLVWLSRDGVTTVGTATVCVECDG